MKHLIAIATLILSIIVTQANAQMPYKVTVRQNTYQPLQNAISLNDTIIWDDEAFKVPLGFTYKLNGEEVDTLDLNFGNLLGTDTSTTIMNGFIFSDMDLADRGLIDGKESKSPIRYKVTGTAGNRICKIEFFNAGFYDEYDIYATMNDSVNFQLWLYEADSKMEIHYGTYQMTYPQNYYVFSNGPMVGYAKEFNYLETSGLIYTLSGSVNQPGIDSFTFTHGGKMLNAYPDNGTVFTFELKTGTTGVGSKQIEQQQVTVYPTNTRNTLHVDMGDIQDADYRIISTTGGSTAIYGHMDRAKGMIDVSSLPAGMYILQLHTGSSIGAYRFIKM